MNDVKKIVVMILVGVVVLFFLATNILLPIVRDNKQQSAQYEQLKREVGAIEKYTKQRLDSSEMSLKEAIATMEKSFLPEGKVQLTEQFTEVSSDSKLVFSNISYRKSILSKEYEIFVVDISAQAPFHDVVAYLAQIEAKELMVGIQSLSLHNISPGSPSLEVGITLLGFRLLDKAPASSQYIEGQYQPFDESRFETLMQQPIDERHKVDTAVALENFDPFFSTYDLNKIKQPDKPTVDDVLISAGTSTSGIEDLKLKGILRLHNTKVALINDRIVKEGEQIAGAVVVAIEDYRVVLKYAEQEYILKMGVDGEFIKR